LNVRTFINNQAGATRPQYQNTMETNIQKLWRLIKLTRIGKLNWYVATVYEQEICLQGKYTDITVKVLKSLKFTGNIGEDGFIRMKRSNISITLT